MKEGENELELDDTKEAFYKIEKSEANSLSNERMRGLYSYNVLDSADLDQAKKVERKMAKYERR